MANEFVARNGVIAQNNSVVTGSLVVTNGITGSMFGTSSQALSSSYSQTSSYASTASYSLSGNGFPFSGSAVITGSLNVTGSTTFANPNLNYGDGVIGPELTTTATFTSGSDWSGSYNSWTHTSGSVSSSITSNLNAVIGNYYIIAVTNTGVTSGSSAYSFGGQGQSGMVSNGTYYTLGGRATTTAPLTIGTTGNFNGTVSVSVKQITPGTASFVLNNVSGSGGTEFRASNNNTTSTFVGFNSGRYNYVGTNTGFGYNALATNTGNTGNTAIGYNTLANLTQIGSSIPFNNTAVGSSAGQNITAGQANTLVGSGAGQAITTGLNNTAVGSGAGQAITTGQQNTLIGQNAGANITGNSNTLIGYQAGGSNSGGTNNTAVGVQSLVSVSSGTQNVAIGVQSGNDLSTGGSNVLIGTSTGRYLNSGANNVIIGTSAGRFLLQQTSGTTLTTNNNSVFIGTDIRSGAQGASNEVVIAGYNGTIGQVGYGSNTTVIGNNLTTNTAIQGNLTLGSLNPVSIGTFVATPSTTGGTLAAGTYYYQIVAVDIYGNTTTPSGEANATTTGTTSSIALSWNAVTGSASYRVYRGIASNAQTVYYTSSINSYTDVNATAVSGTVPTSNTTYLSRINSAGGQTINGSSIFQNATTSSDGGVLGPELTTASGWVSGSDWTGVYNSFTHISGSTATVLTSSLNAVVGNLYNLVFTVTGRNSGSYSATFGGNSVSGQTGTNSGLVGRYATTTALLYVFPTTDFDGTISVSVKQVLTGSALMSLQNSSGTANIEVRASGVSTTNTLIGLSSGRYLVSGTGNTSLGYGTLAVMGAGTNNTAIGYNALTNAQAQSNTPATNNTAVGSGAGAALTIASNNTLVGTNAGTLISTGGSNTLIGTLAGQYITTGTQNTIVGTSSGISTGGSNVIIGNAAGSSVNTSFAVIIGVQAGFSLTSGASNILIGVNSGFSISTGANNIAIGYQAGRYISSGSTANQTSQNSIYLGYDVRASANGDTNEVVIAGYNGTQGTIGLGSNTTVIGNSSTTVTGLYGNLVLVGSGSANLMTGSATGSGYTVNIAGPSTSGSLYSNGFSVFDGTISGSQPANNVSSSLILISGSINPTGSAGTGSAVLLNTVISASANNQTLVGLDLNPTFATTGFTGTTSAALRVGGNIIPNANTTYNIGTNSLNFTSIYVQNINTGGGLNINVGALGINSGGTAQITAGSALVLKASSNTLFTNNNIQNAQVFSTGNWLLQQGGTFTDNGYKLQINGSGSLSGSLLVSGSSIFQNATTSSDGGILGPELTTASGWGSGSDWTGVYNSFTHISGSGNTLLTSSLAAVVGNNYAINYTIATRNSGSITLSYGGLVFSGATTSGTAYGKATSTALLYVIPTADFDGTVSLSVKQVTAGSANTTFQNSSGTANIEVRASGASPTNTFIGLNSGRFSIGSNSYQNTSLGYGALSSIVSAYNNTAIGYNAGASITAGTQNTLIGQSAGGAITTGVNNTTVGSGAGQAITTGTNNLLMGAFAGQNITISSANTLIGYQAGTNITSNSNNTAIGYQGLYALTSGQNNITLGYQAGRYYGGSTSNLLQVIDNSILIGYQAYAGGNSQTNQIVIGYQTTGLGSNTTVIGNSSTTLTGLYGNLVLGGNLITGSATGSGYTLNIAGPSTNGALLVSGSTTISGSATVSGSLTITGYITGSTTAAALKGSGSGVFTVDGTSGRLFSVDDSLSGSLFSVNTAAGLPVVEAFSDNTVRIGKYGSKGLFVSQSSVGIGKETALNGLLDVSGSVYITGSLNTSGSINSYGTVIFDGTISGSQPTNNPSSSLILVSGSFNASGSRTTAVYIAPYLTATGSGQILEAVNINPSFSGSTTSKVALRISTGNLIIGSNPDGGTRALYVGGYIESNTSVLTPSIGVNSIGSYTGVPISISGQSLYLTGSNISMTGSVNITGSLNVSQGITGSSILSTGTITAQTLVVTTISSSVEYSSGSNIFGNSLTNTQTFTGSVNITGSSHTIVGSSFFNGNMVITGSITATAGGFDSDLTLKNIVSRDLLPRYVATEISPIIYTWKDESKGTTPRFGYVAQEVQSLIPEAVYQNGGTLAVDYTQVHTLLIDENTKKIQSLEKEIAELKQIILKLSS